MYGNMEICIAQFQFLCYISRTIPIDCPSVCTPLKRSVSNVESVCINVFDSQAFNRQKDHFQALEGICGFLLTAAEYGKHITCAPHKSLSQDGYQWLQPRSVI